MDIVWNITFSSPFDLKLGAADRGAILLLSWDEPPITFEEFRLGDSFL